MGRANFQIPSKQAFRLPGHGVVDMGGKERYANQRADAYRNADEKV
jgi:hypothetical protein